MEELEGRMFKSQANTAIKGSKELPNLIKHYCYIVGTL